MAALFYAIPASRVLDGLPAENPIFAVRYAPGDDVAATISQVGARAVSLGFAAEIAQAFSVTGGLALLAPLVALPAFAAAAANALADPVSLQASLIGHYYWPIAPWLFWASIKGARKLEHLSRRGAAVFGVALIAFTISQSPLWTSKNDGLTLDQAMSIRRQLAVVPDGAPVAATTNLIPHINHRARVYSIGINEPQVAPTFVVLSEAGNTWPLQRELVLARIHCFRQARGFDQVLGAGIWVFRSDGRQPMPRCHTDSGTPR